MAVRASLKLAYAPYSLRFKEPAGTSRGILHTKDTFFIKIFDENDPTVCGYGEVAVFDGLSKESVSEVEAFLKKLASASLAIEVETTGLPSSIIFGIESALADLAHGGKGILFDSPFVSGKASIEINGLVWMGAFEEMARRAKEKLSQGYKCIKIKIGAIGLEQEMELLRMLREAGGPELVLRVDANGGFQPSECKSLFQQLADLKVHSIEQPIRAGNFEEMKRLCADTPVPIALDEELIGIPPGPERDKLLDYIRPQFLILKPSLCFGLSGTADWIKRAEKRNIGWWLTSALESSVGLNAIAQYAATLPLKGAQGLGTGMLYTNNLPSVLTLQGDRLHFTGDFDACREALQSLDWQYD